MVDNYLVIFVIFVGILVSLWIQFRKKTSLSQVQVKGEERQDNTPSSIFDSLEARARANERIKETFGIQNSFVSPDEHVRAEFRKAMITSKDSFLPSTLDSIVPDAISLFPEQTSIKEIVQIVTMSCVLKGFLEVPPPSLENMKIAANLIDNMWSSEEINKTDKEQLHEIIPAETLSKFIPAWESQWRLVYYSLLEYYRHGPEERKFALENTDLWIKETLRLYPPVKRVIRKDEEGKEISFSIVDHIRNKEIWGEDYLTFNPRREYTKQQNIEMRSVFGMGRLRCVAGLNFVLKFCGGIMKKIGENCECVDEEKWKELISPLENRRDVSSYAQLFICKKD